MNSSMIATIYLIALVVFFILLVVLTITLIASKSRHDEDMEDIDEIFDEDEEDSMYDQEQDDEISEMSDDTDEEDQQNYSDEDTVYEDSAFYVDNEISDDTYVNTFDDVDANGQTEELIQPDVAGIDDEADDEMNDAPDDIPDEDSGSENMSQMASGDISSERTAEMDIQETTDDVPVEENIISEDAVSQEDVPEEIAEDIEEKALEEEVDTEKAINGAEQTDSEGSESDGLFAPGELIDSAFAPEPIETGLTNEALNASVREALAMGDAVSGIGAGLSAEAMFGVREELDKGRKKSRNRSTVPSTDDFFWYNKMDVAEKPSYKTAEMYYHYFDTAKDCIDDLLIEMYDCALVRTEEIRYIAYGIEPKAISMREILSSGNYVSQQKLKEPTTQDLVRIYEKWCGYVDRLFDKVEIHADAYTIDEIRNLLCEFGRNDVDVLLEGK